MAEHVPSDPALAFALYASTAATFAVAALQEAGLLPDGQVQLLMQNLNACLGSVGPDPRVHEHGELLLDRLQRSLRE